jgi:hypothetical protein
VCAYTASGDQALLLSRKCQLLQEEKKEKKNVENNVEKPIFIFTGRILLLFCSASSVCKVDITLYIVSFLEITAWLCHRLSHHTGKVRKRGKKYCCAVLVKLF